MYELFKDLLKVADETFDVSECHLFSDGSIYISGLDGKNEKVELKWGRAVEE
jgi:hypothetical protein